MMRRVPVVATSVAVAALVTVSGCGSSGSAPVKAAAPKPAPSATANGSALVAAAYTTLTNAKTAHLDLTIELTAGSSSGASGANLRSTGTGLLNIGAKQLDLTEHTPTGQDVEERLIGDVAYTKLPPAVASSDPRLHGKPWVREKLTGARTALTLGSDGDASDPTQVLQLLTSESDKVVQAGSEQVRGVSTTHYVATVDLGKAGAKEGASAAEVAQIEKLLGTTTFPVDVWVDGQGLARRVQFHIPLPKSTSATAGAPARETVTEEFYDFGAPVDIKAPPANQVVDAPTSSSRKGTSSSSSSSGSGSSGSGTAHA